MNSYRSPAEMLTYWHRPHTSKTKLPILFLHGIGIGLYPYVNFLAELNENDLDVEDGEVGIIAVEFMSVSFRIVHEALGKDELCMEVQKILAKHGWEKFVLVSHSQVLPYACCFRMRFAPLNTDILVEDTEAWCLSTCYRIRRSLSRLRQYS